MTVHHTASAELNRYVAEVSSIPQNGYPEATRITTGRPAIRVQTLILLLPMFYNVDEEGGRRRVESWKLLQTLAEIRRMFQGYSCSSRTGWFHEEATGEEYDDELIRYEIDGHFDERACRKLRLWKRKLERRFKQRSIYMKLSDAGAWL